MLARDLAHGLEVAGLGEHDAEVHHRRLHDHAGGRAALLDEALDAALHGLGVVERHRDRHVDDGLRDAAAVGQRGEVVAVADLVVVDADRDHHVVVVAVVGAEDLHDRVAAGVGARDADRVHRRLGAGVDVAPLRQPPAARELLGDDDRVLGRRGEVGAELDPLRHGLRDGRVGVALHHRAEAVVEVEQLVAVDVPDVRRPCRARGRSATGRAAGTTTRRRRRGCCGPLVERPRALCPLVQPRRLALGQLPDPGAVDLDVGRCGHDGGLLLRRDGPILAFPLTAARIYTHRR